MGRLNLFTSLLCSMLFWGFRTLRVGVSGAFYNSTLSKHINLLSKKTQHRYILKSKNHSVLNTVSCPRDMPTAQIDEFTESVKKRKKKRKKREREKKGKLSVLLRCTSICSKDLFTTYSVWEASCSHNLLLMRRIKLKPWVRWWLKFIGKKKLQINNRKIFKDFIPFSPLSTHVSVTLLYPFSPHLSFSSHFAISYSKAISLDPHLIVSHSNAHTFYRIHSSPAWDLTPNSTKVLTK